MILTVVILIFSLLSALGAVSITTFLFVTERRAPRFSKSIKKIEIVQRDTLLSVIITAKNEEQTIGRCLESLIAQTHENLEIIVVDDESSDDTVKVSQKFSDRDKRIRVVGAGVKPSGWFGKNWPCQKGFENSRGEFLLFVDADSEFDKAVISLALNYALSLSIDMLSLSPRLRLKGVWSRATVPLLTGAINLLYPMTRVNDPDKKRAYVFGTFVLVLRKTYEEIGGHASVKDKLVEDAAIAQRAKSSGHKLRVEIGNEFASSDWESELKVIYHGLERVFSDSVRPYGLLSILNAVLVFFLGIFPLIVVGGYLAFESRYSLTSLGGISFLVCLV
ncbi:MAG TPA: glycosyltransferase family 2 protein, partial [Nitrososphaerales archaeon]|nr:glycosyltransferase family 2 protein [Nitrososphaerales archaeon]